MNNRYLISRSILFIALFAVLMPLPWIDPDEAAFTVRQTYGRDVFEESLITPCATDGVEISHAPLGHVLKHCDSSWYVPLNVTAIQLQ